MWKCIQISSGPGWSMEGRHQARARTSLLGFIPSLPRASPMHVDFQKKSQTSRWRAPRTVPVSVASLWERQRHSTTFARAGHSHPNGRQSFARSSRMSLKAGDTALARTSLMSIFDKTNHSFDNSECMPLSDIRRLRILFSVFDQTANFDGQLRRTGRLLGQSCELGLGNSKTISGWQ